MTLDFLLVTSPESFENSKLMHCGLILMLQSSASGFAHRNISFGKKAGNKAEMHD